MALKLTTTREAVQANGFKILVYGQAGAGKTVLSATTGGNPLIISAEAGLLSLRNTDFTVAEISSLTDLKEVYEYVAKSAEAAQYDWICLDSISEVAEVVLSTEKKDSKDPRQAYGALLEQMHDIIRAFRDLPRNIYMSAKMERAKDDESGRMIHSPSAPGAKLGQALPYFFDEVFALRVEKNAQGEFERMLQTQPDYNYVAKDRSGVLDAFELPDLAHIAAKILNPQHDPSTSITHQTQVNQEPLSTGA